MTFKGSLVNAKRIVVVGGGPAGMMAAIRAGQSQEDVTLIEKNPVLGKKLLLSGKGRCNLTNLCDLDAFMGRFSKNGQFLRDAFKKFFNHDLMDFFEKRGLELRVERQLRVFPVTDRSSSILEILKAELEKNKVRVIYRARLKEVVAQDNEVKGLLFSDGHTMPADRVILATGGVSYGFTGSTGEGLEIAKKLGHSVTALRPGLVPLETKEKFPKALEGLVLKNIRLKFSNEKKQIISEVGELLFTDFGISGPLVLTYSGQIADWFSQNKNVYVDIDLKPALSVEQLEARFLREFKANPKRSIKNMLKGFLPASLIGVFLDIAKIPREKKVSQITQDERKALSLLLKGMRLNIARTKPIEEAMVTRGGVSLKEIDPRTLGSRLVKGLYFAGEIMDIDADTGGFNLQAAFSTGYLAGESAAIN